jgi:single-strand DNA-binding protein
MFENNVHLMGRLTADPEVRVAGENKVTNFTVAINRPAKKDAHPEADFVRCVAWNKDADFLEKYFGKGDRIGIEGRLQVRNYDDKDGNKRSATEVVVSRLAFIEKKGTPTAQTAPSAEPANYDDEDDDLPI